MGFVAEDLKTILNTFVYAWLTHGAVTGTFQKWETITETTSNATGIIVELNNTTMMIKITSGTFVGTNLITGSDSGATTTLSAIDLSEPFIRLLYDDRPSSFASDGEMIIDEERKNNVDDMVKFRNNSFRIMLELNFDNQTDPIKLNRLFRQLEYSMDGENRLPKASRIISTKDYWWKNIYSWGGQVQIGLMNIFVDVVQRWIPV